MVIFVVSNPRCWGAIEGRLGMDGAGRPADGQLKTHTFGKVSEARRAGFGIVFSFDREICTRITVKTKIKDTRI